MNVAKYIYDTQWLSKVGHFQGSQRVTFLTAY